MSEQVSYRPRISPSKRAAQAIAAASGTLHVRADEWLASCDRQTFLQKGVADSLAQLESDCRHIIAHHGESAREILKIQALHKGLESVSNLQAVLTNDHGPLMAEFRSQSDILLQQLTNGTAREQLLQASGSLQKRLLDVVSQAHQSLLETENRVVSDLIGNTLTTMGYEVEERRGAMRGTKGKTCIWVDTGKEGDITLDVSGFSGTSCRQEIKNLENRLAVIGLEMNRTSIPQEHGEDGGALAASLARVFSQAPVKKYYSAVAGSKTDKNAVEASNNLIKTSSKIQVRR